jgi:hypothetical protein
VTYPSQQRSAGLWLGLSIAATVACCLPLGIPGIVYAAKAMGDEGRGDWAAAEENVRIARLWTLWSAGIVIGLTVLFVCFGVLNGFSQYR